MERLPLVMVQHMCLRKGMDASGSRQQLIDRLEQRELQERFEEMGHPRAVAPPQPPPAAAAAAAAAALSSEEWYARSSAAAAAAASAAARAVPAIQIHTPPITLERGGEAERAPLSPLEEEGAGEAAPTPSPGVGALPRHRPEALQGYPEEDYDSAPSSPADRPKSARGRPGADPFHYVSPSRVRPGAGGDGDDSGDGGDGGDGEAGRPKTARGRGGDPFGYVSPSRTRDGGQTTQRLDLDPEAAAFVPGGGGRPPPPGGGFSAAMLAAAQAEGVEGEEDEEGSPVSSAYSSPVLVARPGDEPQPQPQPQPLSSAAERLGSRAAQYLAGGGGGATQRREAAAAAGDDDFDDIDDFDDARDFFDARAGFTGTGMARNYAAAAAAAAAAATAEDYDDFDGALKAAMAGARAGFVSSGMPGDPRVADDDITDSDDDSDDDDQEGDDVALSAADLRQISNVGDQVPSLAQLRARLEQARREEGGCMFSPMHARQLQPHACEAAAPCTRGCAPIQARREDDNPSPNPDPDPIQARREEEVHATPLVPGVVQLGAEARARLAAMRATEAAGPTAALAGNPEEGLLNYMRYGVLEGEEDEVEEASEEEASEEEEGEEVGLSQTDHLNKSLLESFKARLGRPATPCTRACGPVC